MVCTSRKEIHDGRIGAMLDGSDLRLEVQHRFLVL